ncbi:MAG: hypothetical protein QHH14_14265 [Clostridiales bacterium]|nr:hypothetical protein [Clostridiales bacterium]
MFFIAAGLLLNFITPPFQNPDEPHHFGAVMVYALGEDKRDFVEKEILRLMDENDWWRFAGMGRREPLPERLSEIPYLMGYYPISDFRERLAGLTFYHFLLGRGIRLTGVENIGVAYYGCRLVSFIFILGSLLLAFSAFRKMATRWGGFFLFVPFFVLFLPQFAVLSISVSSDAPAIFLGSLFFCAAFSLISGGFRAGPLALLWGSAFLGLVTDRSAFSLIFLAALCLIFGLKITRKNYQNYIVGAIALFLVFLLAAYFLVLLFPLEIDNSVSLISQNWQRALRQLPRLFSVSDFNRRFYISLADSFLLRFGWMAFSAAKIFYWVWRGLVVLAGLGVFVYAVRVLIGWISRMSRGNRQHFSLVFFCAAAVFAQLAGLWGYYGANKILPQGRYFFPMIIPLVFLFFLGLENLLALISRKAVAVGLGTAVVFEFIFFGYVVWTYIIPVFHLTLKAPHPGI